MKISRLPLSKSMTLAVAAGLVAVGCMADPDELVVPTNYEFESRFDPGTDSVSHSGQTARQVLIYDMGDYIGALTEEIDSGSFEPTTDGDVVSRLEYFFSLDGADRAGDPIRLTVEPSTLQMTYGDISGANLFAKLAGNDTATDHRDWATEFTGWSDASIAVDGGGVDSPTNFVRAIFETIETNAIARNLGTDRLSPAGEALPVHVTENGVDLEQLVSKFLLGAVTYSQAADDYTDDDVEGKGLLSDNVEAHDGTDPYTSLEHAWDESFGYFGGAIAYGDRSVSEIASTRGVDRNGDGMVDLLRECDFGASRNAGKRDNGSADAARTQFAEQAFLAFRTGRAIITHADGALDADQMAALREQRDLAIGAWESAIAATVVHYINEVLVDMQAFDTAEYDHDAFLNHAKHWSEMKGFALMFQFSPRSALSRDQFVRLHTLVADAPVLPAAGATSADAYRAALLEARGILGTAYSFDAANLGNTEGTGGW